MGFWFGNQTGLESVTATQLLLIAQGGWGTLTTLCLLRGSEATDSD